MRINTNKFGIMLTGLMLMLTVAWVADAHAGTRVKILSFELNVQPGTAFLLGAILLLGAVFFFISPIQIGSK